MRFISVFLAAVLSAGASLAADAPAPSPDKAFFDRLVGTWDVQYEIYDKDGKLRKLPGKAVYAWILGGGALQETWSDVDGQAVKPYATTIDYEDGKTGRWTAVYIYPQSGAPTVVTGGAADGVVVLQGHDPEGALQRWTLSDFGPRSFTAHYETSADEGKTWRLLGINHLQRVP